MLLLREFILESSLTSPENFELFTSRYLVHSEAYYGLYSYLCVPFLCPQGRPAMA